VLLLVLHLGLLLLKALRLLGFRHNSMLELLNFVIEHEFELLKLLHLLSESLNFVLLVLNGTLSFGLFVRK
jgi:hypothetical protein